MSSNLAAAYLRWAFVRAALARGYWVVTALYLVVVAHLSPFQLILIGTFQSITVLVANVPAGVLADDRSRRRVLVIAHVVTGAGMAMAGLVRSFPLLAVSQCLWGLGWAIASGADVAWLTDELDPPARVEGVLVAQARWDLLGRAAGTVVFAALASATTLSSAIVVSGAAMTLLGLAVVRWPETRAGRTWAPAVRPTMSAVLRRGFARARMDRVVVVIIVATALVNGGTAVVGRLREQRLLALGLPSHPGPIVWFSGLTLVGIAMGALALRIVETRLDRLGSARGIFVAVCALGAIGTVGFACAANAGMAAAGVLVASGRPLAIRSIMIIRPRAVIGALRCTRASREFVGLRQPHDLSEAQFIRGLPPTSPTWMNNTSSAG